MEVFTAELSDMCRSKVSMRCLLKSALYCPLGILLLVLLPAALLAQSSSRAPNSVKMPTLKSIDEYLLFYPSKYPEGDWEPAELPHQDVFFQSADGTQLHGWYCPAAKPRGFLLIAHGNAGHIAHRANWLRYLQRDLQLSVFAFDYRGYGRSRGTPSVQGAIDDSVAARAKLRELANIEDKDMILMGESLGGAMVIQLASQSSPKALILQSTFPSLREVAAVHFPNLAWMVSRRKLVSADAITKYQGPLLISHGQEDRTIPHALGKKLFDNANEPKQWVSIPGADHNNWLTEDYLKRLDQFLQKLP
jgi:fermentation-respiration switch protein FrsA (DUF1100 family)